MTFDIGMVPKEPPMDSGEVHLHAFYLRGVNESYYWRWVIVNSITELCRNKDRCRKYLVLTA